MARRIFLSARVSSSPEKTWSTDSSSATSCQDRPLHTEKAMAGRLRSPRVPAGPAGHQYGSKNGSICTRQKKKTTHVLPPGTSSGMSCTLPVGAAPGGCRMTRSAHAGTPASTLMPQHIAIVMDGNGRWAKQRFLPRMAGHVMGVESLKKIVKACARKNIPYLTVFAFSSENWRRPTEEVIFLMDLFVASIKKEVAELHAHNVCLKVVGDLAALDEKLRDVIDQAEKVTASNASLTLTICANYGGQWDIMQATEKLLRANPAQTAFTPEELGPYLSMAYAPDPDLFIRTGGEQRISNFLLWQLAYTELYFTQALWPDFDENALDDAIRCFVARERRYGQTSEQLTP